jgi:hypothetical protein
VHRIFDFLFLFVLSLTGSLSRHTRRICRRQTSQLPKHSQGAPQSHSGSFRCRWWANFFLLGLTESSHGFLWVQSELKLLQSLRHPRIVKYIDSLTTDDSLYIVLEYVLHLINCKARGDEHGGLASATVLFLSLCPMHLCSNRIHSI